MHGEGPIEKLAIGTGLSLDLVGVWDFGGERVYACLFPGESLDTPYQRVVLGNEHYRTTLRERVRKGQQESLPEFLDESSREYWDCSFNELPLVACSCEGTTVYLPPQLCDDCGIGEGTTLLARPSTRDSLWLYPDGELGADRLCG